MSGLMSATIAFLAAANLWLWLLVFDRLRAGKALVAFEARRPTPWRGSDLVAVAIAYLACNLAVGAVGYMLSGGPDPGLDGDISAAEREARMRVLLMGGAAVNASTIAAAAGWIRWRRGADWGDLGVESSKVCADVFLGLAAFALVSVPIYALQAAVTQLVPSEHPLVKDWQALAEPGWALRISFIVAVVFVAPFAEEFLFRVLLQGWLESLSAETASAERHDLEPTAPAAIQSSLPNRRWTPIVLSSVVFALMHVSHGADVVPLFFFALALGYLYRQTHRIWPSVVLHLSLNACTLAILWIGPPL